jgi:ATP adenylyltransferase
MSDPADTIRSIWAPWRVEYFQSDRSCDFLSEAAQSNDDASHLVVTRRKATFLMMNRYPYAVGHMMAVPYRRAAGIEELTEGERAELWELAIVAQELLRSVIRAEGFNIGLNLGACAGAGVLDHLHLHIVPRWAGDNNFMPVLAGTRVMPEALSALYAKLAEAARRES